jgi:hypothetical protein
MRQKTSNTEKTFGRRPQSVARKRSVHIVYVHPLINGKYLVGQCFRWCVFYGVKKQITRPLHQLLGGTNEYDKFYLK